MKYRHGDVILLDPIEIPADATIRTSGVVAEGEVTGHAHRIVNGTVFEHGGALMVSAKDDASLVHEEHDTLPLRPTDHRMAYPIIIQREYDDQKEWRQVAD